MATIAQMSKDLLEYGVSQAEIEELKKQGKQAVEDKLIEFEIDLDVEEGETNPPVKVETKESVFSEEKTEVYLDEISFMNPSDPKFYDLAISKLLETEISPQGLPTAEGLRRIIPLVLGVILEDTIHVVSAPCEANGYNSTVENRLAIRFGYDNEVRIFSDAADSGPMNDDVYANFPTASASTKAKGRTYKIALNLRKLMTAEEVGTSNQPEVASEPKGIAGSIAPSQISAIKMICDRLKIDTKKFINMGKRQYGRLEEISDETAKAMIKLLNEYQNTKNTKTIPDSIKRD